MRRLVSIGILAAALLAPASGLAEGTSCSLTSFLVTPVTAQTRTGCAGTLPAGTYSMRLEWAPDATGLVTVAGHEQNGQRRITCIVRAGVASYCEEDGVDRFTVASVAALNGGVGAAGGRITPSSELTFQLEILALTAGTCLGSVCPGLATGSFTVRTQPL